ncbi:MAG: PIG-L deacetylase family protein [Promethearchaeota archaeon]
MNNKRILIIEAHPDDMTFFYGGTISRLARLGYELKLITITRGSQSTLNPNYSEKEIIQILSQEHQNALKILGIRDFIQFNEFTNHFIYDGNLKLRLREKLIREIRKFKPQTIISFDISNIYDENPDHRVLGELVLEAAAFSAYPLIHSEHKSEGLKPHFTTRVIMTPTPSPNFYFNFDEIDLDNKIKAAFCYNSQLELMYDELNHRLETIGVNSEISKTPIEVLWPMICKSDAKACANEAKQFYSQNSQLNPYSQEDFKKFKYAEEFRIVFLGVLEKVKEILPIDAYKL